MASLTYYDCNAMLGRYFNPAFGDYLTAGALEQLYDRYGISAGVVYHSSAKDYSPAYGNRALLDELKGRERLHGAWVVTPHHTCEMEKPEQLTSSFRSSGVRMARIFCGSRYYTRSLDLFVYAALLGALEHHRIPVMVEFDAEQSGGGSLDDLVWQDVRAVLDACPRLRFVLACPKSTGLNRNLFPLMEKYENLFLETSGYQLFGGLETVSRRFGARRLLYGSRAPYFDPAPGMIAIQYSELEESEKRMIAGDGLSALLREVRL
jgi:predicted TIM-barrel fold metal-dependent hydrolase